MRNRRRHWLLRRLVLGLAVAAIAAPTATAALDEGGTARSGDNGVVIQGDDKVLAPVGGGVLVQGDDKVFAPESRGVLVRGDDKVIPRADWYYTQLAYRHAMPQDYRVAVLAEGDETIQVKGGHPAGRQVPLAASSTRSDFGWSDGAIVAIAALGLTLMAFGAARSTGRMARPAAA